MYWNDDEDDLLGMNSELDWMLLEEEMDFYLNDGDEDTNQPVSYDVNEEDNHRDNIYLEVKDDDD